MEWNGNYNLYDYLTHLHLHIYIHLSNISNFLDKENEQTPVVTAGLAYHSDPWP